MGAFRYGGRFERIMNDLSSPQNIAATSTRFAELERQHGSYSFGKFVKFTISQPEEYAQWESDVGEIPQWIQDRLTEIISTNLKSTSPMPVVLKVGDNVDATHDLHVKAFAHNGQIYIGLHMLCPNTDLK
jgi:hypothetical protein